MRLSLGRMATAMVVGVVLLTLAGTPGALAQTSPTSPQTRVAERHQTALEASGSGVATMSVGCYGDTCSGKDPQAMGCSADARTLASYRRVPDAYSDDDWLVELRYSHNCQAQWTRGTVYYMSTYFGLERCTTLGATSCGRLYTKYAMADYTRGGGMVARHCLDTYAFPLPWPRPFMWVGRLQVDGSTSLAVYRDRIGR